VFDLPREDAVEASADWLDDLSDGDTQVAVYRLDPQRRAKQRSGKLNRRLALKDMREELSVQVTAEGGSLAFGTGVLANDEDQRVVALRVSTTDLERVPTWRARIDAAAERSELLQAALYLTGPVGESLDVTAYEQACGAAHGVTTLRDWAERWVRVPGDQGLWLGPSLLAHLDDAAHEALSEVASVASVGECLRVVLSERQRLDDLEHALAAFLPSRDDGRKAMTALYAQG
jgi:hypothetical protein